MKSPLDRVDLDAYYSPEKLIEAYLRLPSFLGKRPYYDLDDSILEPCAGSGAFVKVFNAHGFQMQGTDLVNGAEYDATTPAYWENRHPDWVITNPPFNRATEILKLALEHSQIGVTMLLRASYLEPCKDRRGVLSNGLTFVTSVNPRPRFRTDSQGSDNCTVAFFTWVKNNRGGSSTVNFLTDWHL